MATQTATKEKLEAALSPATSIGTLTLKDGTPDTATIDLIYDNLDRSRAYRQVLRRAVPEWLGRNGGKYQHERANNS